MFGGNYFGHPYYGQGPTENNLYLFVTLSASVSTSASISTVVVVTKTISATVSAVASIARLYTKILSATVIASGRVSRSIVRTLNLFRAATKMLNQNRSTIGISLSSDTYFQSDYFQNDYFQTGLTSGGHDRSTVGLGQERTTRKIN